MISLKIKSQFQANVDNYWLKCLKSVKNRFSQIVLSFLVIWVIYYDYRDSMLDGQSLIQFINNYFKLSEESDRLLLGDLWFSIHQKSLQLIQPMIERYIAVWLWDPVFLFILQLPLAVILFFGLVVVFIINIFFRLFWP